MHVPPSALSRAKDKLAQVKKDLSIQAGICERSEKALQRLKMSGASPQEIAAAEDALMKQINLYMQRLEQWGRPATRAYAQALRAQVLNANMPLEAVMKEFAGLFGESQATGLTGAMGTQAHIRQFVDKVCKRALVEVKGRHSDKPFVNLQNAHLIAEALGAEDLPSHQEIMAIFNQKAKEAPGR